MSKKNRAALRRALFTLSLVLVVAFAAVGGTLAWLQSNVEMVVNTFTYGKVEITLDETDVDVYGKKDGETRVTKNDYKLLPGQTYTKDPIVHVTQGSEQCWLFVKVVNPLTAIETTTAADTVAGQIEANGWVELEKEGNSIIYAYPTVVDARTAAQNVDVFEKFVVNGEKKVDDLKAYENQKITIDAYAIQYDNLTTYQDAWKAQSADWTK